MINPHLLDATYLKLDRPGPRYRSGMKLYRPAFGSHGAFKGCRHAFRTATRAREHATRVLERWCRLYDALAAHAASTGDAGSKPARGAAVAMAEVKA